VLLFWLRFFLLARIRHSTFIPSCSVYAHLAFGYARSFRLAPVLSVSHSLSRIRYQCSYCSLLSSFSLSLSVTGDSIVANQKLRTDVSIFTRTNSLRARMLASGRVDFVHTHNVSTHEHDPSLVGTSNNFRAKQCSVWTCPYNRKVVRVKWNGLMK